MTLELVNGDASPGEKLEIRTLQGRYRCLVRFGGMAGVYTLVLCEKNLSPSREFIQVGDYYSDQLRGWIKVDQLEVVEILAKINDQPAVKRPWWKRRLRFTFQ